MLLRPQQATRITTKLFPKYQPPPPPPQQLIKRWVTTLKNTEIPEELIPFTEGRGRQERGDSITLEILQERKNQYDRLQQTILPDGNDVKLQRILEEDGFGQKKRLTGLYQGISEVTEDYATNTGAGGSGVLLGSFNLELPIFDHLLPEIAMLGHSNSGKSTLVNALIGILPKSGPAGVSDRAGWTNHVYYYRLGRKPPVMTLVDFPGYGFAVANEDQKFLWKRMTYHYLKHRSIMSKCCILVDSQRGLCREDRQLLKFVSKLQLPWMIVLTKADLLSSEELLKTIFLMKQDLLPYTIPKFHNSPASKFTIDELLQDSNYRQQLVFRYGHPNERVWPVSSSTGAGVTKLWKMINHWVKCDYTPFTGKSNVREHRNAIKTRRDGQKKFFQDLEDDKTIKISNRELRQLKK